MGRKLRSRAPCHPDELLPRIPDYDELCRHERRYREKMEQHYNHRHRVEEGERLCSGDRVWIPDLRTEGSVVKHHDTPRSVLVQTQRSTVRRNRRMTRKLQNQPDIEPIVNTSEPLRPCRATVPATSSDDEPGALTQEVHPERSVEPEENLEPVTTMAPRRSERPRRPPRRYIEEYWSEEIPGYRLSMDTVKSNTFALKALLKFCSLELWDYIQTECMKSLKKRKEMWYKLCFVTAHTHAQRGD